MAQLNTKVKKYLEANSKVYLDELNNFVLQNDGSGDYIKEWNVDGVAEPTAEQLNAVESEADAQETLDAVIATRSFEYPRLNEFAEAYCEKEIGGDSTKWDAYVTKYNLVRSNNPKP
jgi:hypothetical protein|tara:strand:- start:67 stop:417 length:351 start_codon:yes stop_codon:yes gene_type:complete